MWDLRRCILSFISAWIHSFGHKWGVWGCYVENKQEKKRKEYKAIMWVQYEKLTQENEGFCFDFLSISLPCLTENSPLHSHSYFIVSVHISIQRVLWNLWAKGNMNRLFQEERYLFKKKSFFFFLRTINLKFNSAKYWAWTKAHVSLAGTELQSYIVQYFAGSIPWFGILKPLIPYLFLPLFKNILVTQILHLSDEFLIWNTDYISILI